MKKIFAFGVAALLLASCNMDFVPSDTMTSDQIRENPAAALYTTNGIYSMFKDALAYSGESPEYPNGRNQYLRHYYQLTELRSDNVTISGVTSDPFINPYDYREDPEEENIYYTWWIGYKIIYSANSNIAVLTPGESDESDHLLGENYFLRALGHFHMVTLFAMPYVYWKDHPEAMGVVEHRGMDSYSGDPVRANIGDIYTHIVEDLQTAITYLEGNNVASRKGKAFVQADAAKALLARVYLYMEMNQECLDVCTDLMAHAPADVIGGYDFKAFPTKTYDMDETIFCIKPNITDWFYSEHPQSAIGSMYYSDTDFNQFDGDNGWGEHYWSEELIDLFQRYPQDKRFAAYFIQEPPAEENVGKLMVTFPIKTKSSNAYCSSGIVHGLTAQTDGSVKFGYKGRTYTAVPTLVNGYTQYLVEDPNFVSGNDNSSVQKRVYVRNDGGVRTNGGQFAIYYNTKFNGMEGRSNLTAPALLRWGEVILNKAEAEAKLHLDAEALADVDIIRSRAGLPAEAMFSSDMHGYTSVLDVVLDERRMEFCFEGLRYFDVFRNRRKMDRRFVGFHAFGDIDWTDPRLALLIPLDEINASKIPQNPR